MRHATTKRSAARLPRPDAMDLHQRPCTTTSCSKAATWAQPKIEEDRRIQSIVPRGAELDSFSGNFVSLAALVADARVKHSDSMVMSFHTEPLLAGAQDRWISPATKREPTVDEEQAAAT